MAQKRCTVALVAVLLLCTACVHTDESLIKEFLAKEYPSADFSVPVQTERVGVYESETRVLGRPFKVTIAVEGARVSCTYSEAALLASQDLIGDYLEERFPFPVTVRGVKHVSNGLLTMTAEADAGLESPIDFHVLCRLDAEGVSDDLMESLEGASFYFQAPFFLVNQCEHLWYVTVRSVAEMGEEFFIMEFDKTSAGEVMALVRSQAGKEGWTPAWYLSRTSKQGAALPEEALCVVVENDSLSPYPKEVSSNDDHLILDKGTVVARVAVLGEWALVRTAPWTQGDVVHIGWVIASNMVAFDPLISLEGWTSAPVTVYDDCYGAPDLSASTRFDVPLRFEILDRQGSYVLLACGKGIVGWVDENSLQTKNPFQHP